MSFRDDDRGASVQVGVVILFGFLVLAIAGWQATVVPQDNAAIEYTHNQRVKGDMQDVRNSIISAPGGRPSPSAAIDMAPQYPPRTLFVNPGPPSATIRTVGTTNSSINLTVDNATVADTEADDYWDGTTKSFNSGGLAYEPGYNVYTGAPTTVYENSVLYDRNPDVDVTITGQDLVDGRRISLVTLNGSITASRSDSYSLDVDQVSASSTTVPIENTPGDSVTVSFASRLNAATWRSLLNESGELDPNDADSDAYVAAVRSEPITVDGVQFNRVTLVLEQGETYTLQMAKVGVGSGIGQERPTYGVDVRGDGTTVSRSDSRQLVVEVRDGFNNPVSGATVSNASGTDLNGGSLGAEEVTTGADGRAAFEFTPGSTGTATIQFNVSQDATVTGAELVNFTVEVTGGSGGSGGAYNTFWQNPDGQTGVTCDGSGDCTVDASQTNDVTLTASTSPTAIDATVDFASNNTSVGTISPTTGQTDSNGEADTTFSVTQNGTAKVYASSGGSGDVINLTVEGVVGGPFLAVTIDDTNEPVTEGGVLLVNATVENTGDSADTQTIELRINGSLEDTDTVTVPAGGTDTVNLSYTTQTGDAPEVDVDVSSDNDTDTTTATVNEPTDAFFDVTIDGTNEPVTEGENLTVNVTVENTGTVQDTQDIVFAIDGVEEDRRSNETIAAGGSKTYNFTYTTEAGDAPSVDVDVSSDNDTDSTTATVNEPAFFDVTIDDTNEPVTEGEDLLVNVTVRNTGDLQDTQDIVLLINGTQEDIRTGETIAGGATETYNFTYTTQVGDSPEVNATVTSENDSDTTLAEVRMTMADRTELVAGSGDTATGDSSTVVFDLQNVGNAPVNVTGITVDSTSDNQADVVDNDGNCEFQGGGGCADVNEITIGDATVTTVDPESEIVDGQTESFSLGQFRRNSGQTRNMNNKQVTITLHFADGSQRQYTINT